MVTKEEAWKKWIDDNGKYYNVYETNAARDAFFAGWDNGHDAGSYEAFNSKSDWGC